MKLNSITTIEADLVLLTGLHIGSGDSEMHIGGIDNPVVKHPVTGEPYIPGSSIKGKMRSLLEWRSGAVQEEPLSLKEAGNNPKVKEILQLFGISANKDNPEDKMKEIGIARLAFWDCTLAKTWAEARRNNSQLFTEAKSENTINRISGTAKNPRYTERVPSGASFKFKLTMKKLDGDSGELLNTVLTGLKLLELDSLGGSGSRGYGKIKFENLMIDDEAKSLENIKPFETVS